MRSYLRRAVQHIGEDNLNISANDVGTHSIRASFAMLMLLNNEPDSLVMKKGRWKSNAFLAYIRLQISAYGVNVSKNMVRKRHNYKVIQHIGRLKLE